MSTNILHPKPNFWLRPLKRKVGEKEGYGIVFCGDWKVGVVGTEWETGSGSDGEVSSFE